MHCCVHERERVCVYVHACVWVRMYDVYICLYAVVCVCVRERERERERVCVCVYMHVCVLECMLCICLYAELYV